MSTLSVSIIMPARNAAATIQQTLASVLAQTYGAWDVVVVDDGSTDDTRAAVAAAARGDARIQVVTGAGRGVSAARNVGIGAARGDWLLFLDADDVILPRHLELLAALVRDDPAAGVACSGWAYLTPDGEIVRAEHLQRDGDLFGEFGYHAVLPIHALLVRKSLVEQVGGFDEALVTCEDWDLWQRIARLGTRFCKHDEVQALYRMRVRSASRDSFRMLHDGLSVMRRGHDRDPRVPDDAPHAAGLSPVLLPARSLTFACWTAGQHLGGGGDAVEMLDALGEPFPAEADPRTVASVLFQAGTLARCLPDQAWPSLLPDVEAQLDRFLMELERRTAVPLLARRVRRALERQIVARADPAQSLTVGRTHSLSVDAADTVPDIVTPARVERLLCRVTSAGRPVALVDLPVCDRLVPASVLADAIAADLFWVLLRDYLTPALYADIASLPAARRLALGLETTDPAATAPETVRGLHDRIGWTAFLQALWDRPEWPAGRFYDAEAADIAGVTLAAPTGALHVEVSGPLPTVTGVPDRLEVVVTVGGALLGTISVAAANGVVPAQRLRAEVTRAGGLELCRLAVREGILGRPLADGVPLMVRLAARARSRAFHPSLPGVPADLARPGWTLLARRSPGPTLTAADRRAMLPSIVLPALHEAAAATGEVWTDVPADLVAEESAPAHAAYLPDLALPDAAPDPATAAPTPVDRPRQATEGLGAVYGRQYFELLFASAADPWKYTSEYEQRKYEQTLSLFPSRPIGSALELACAEGHFTIQMAPRVGRLLAADIAQIGLERTEARCRAAGLSNVEYARLDLVKDDIPGRYDLIVCSEVLYYTGDRPTLAAIARKMAAALNPGGRLVMAHGNAVADEPDGVGFDWGLPFGARTIGEVFASTPSLRLAHEIRTPLYRVQAFDRVGSLASLVSRVVPSRLRGAVGAHLPDLERVPHARNLPPDVAAHARLGGVAAGERHAVATTVTTDRLPILMYHRIADSGPERLARYRVSPARFEEQLRYLRDAGYSGVTLADWHAAMTAREPLPGRAVLLTFDDGYQDFATEAWPLLQQYGFPATVFLVADRIGEVSAWDAAYGEPAPLMGWDAILRLQAAGVEFGAHTCTHPPLTALSPAEVVEQAARARAILTHGLGRPVPAFAYPYGDHDAAVRHLVGASGFTYGLTCDERLSTLSDGLLALPRVEVRGEDTLATFVARLAT